MTKLQDTIRKQTQMIAVRQKLAKSKQEVTGPEPSSAAQTKSPTQTTTLPVPPAQPETITVTPAEVRLASPTSQEQTIPTPPGPFKSDQQPAATETTEPPLRQPRSRASLPKRPPAIKRKEPEVTACKDKIVSLPVEEPQASLTPAGPPLRETPPRPQLIKEARRAILKKKKKITQTEGPHPFPGVTVEDVMTPEFLQQLSGYSVPHPEVPNDPIREIMDKGVEDALRSAGMEEETPPTGPNLETGEIPQTPIILPAFTPTAEAPEPIFPSVPETIPQPTEATVPFDPIPATTTVPVIPLSKPLATSTKSQTQTTVATSTLRSESRHSQHTEGPTPPFKFGGSYAVPEMGEKLVEVEGRSWKQYLADAALPRTVTMGTLSTDVGELWKKHDTAVDKLYKDINSINDKRRGTTRDLTQLRKDLSLQTETTNKLRKELEAEKKKSEENAKSERKERILLSGRLDTVCRLYNELTGEPVPHVAPIPQAAPVAPVAPGSSTQDLCKKYNEGYEDAIVNLANRGYLPKEVLDDEQVIPPGFERMSDLWHAFRYAKQTHSEKAKGHSRHCHEGSSHGKR